jgi:hypothetical protein
MRKKFQTQQPQFNYVPMMVPVPVTNPENRDDKKSDLSVFGAFFWAIIIILSIWFITGGYNALQ